MAHEMDNPATLDALLVWLGQGKYDGALKYEEIRRRLIYIFTCRGCHTPEELADETIDRTALAIARPGFQYQGDPTAYFYGVAQNIHHEWLRRELPHLQEPITGDLPDRHPWSLELGTAEILASCLEKCLLKLPAERRQILLRYYRNEKGTKIKNRKDLADQNGVGANALRIQLFRLRNQVRNCVRRCVRQSEM